MKEKCAYCGKKIEITSKTPSTTPTEIIHGKVAIIHKRLYFCSIEHGKLYQKQNPADSKIGAW